VSDVALASGPIRGKTRRHLAVALVAALAAALAAWLLLRGGGEGPAAPESPETTSIERLRDVSASVGHDVYWAGSPAVGTALELTHQADGRIYVRYLTGNGEVGDARPRFTTVGTYPVQAALAALRKQAKQPAAITRKLPDGGFAYMSADHPTSVYLAWPRSGYEVEVFDPSPKRALELVLAGAIAPVR
jgi:hypothetical protein